MARSIEHRRSLALSLGITALTAGCSLEDPNHLLPGPDAGTGASGGDGPSGPCGDGGRSFFEESVLPILDDGQAGEVCARCHSTAYQDSSGAPDFMGSSAAETYEKLVGNVHFVSATPGNSLLLAKGEHSGPAFTSAQEATVKQWLGIEAATRFGSCEETGGTGGLAGKSCEEALTEFGACMTLAGWTGTGMELIATQKTLQNGPCHKCHGSGSSGNTMTEPLSDAAIVLGFETMRVPPALLNLVRCSLNAQTGAFEEIEPSYRWRDMGSEASHPAYILSPEKLAALDIWFDLAHAAWESGPCAP